MSSREFVEWQVYDKLSPIGGKRLDYLFALFMSLFASAHRKKHGKRFKPSDFLPAWGGKKKRKRSWMSPDEIWKFMEEFAKSRDG